MVSLREMSEASLSYPRIAKVHVHIQDVCDRRRHLCNFCRQLISKDILDLFVHNIDLIYSMVFVCCVINGP